MTMDVMNLEREAATIYLNEVVCELDRAELEVEAATGHEADYHDTFVTWANARSEYDRLLNLLGVETLNLVRTADA